MKTILKLTTLILLSFLFNLALGKSQSTGPEVWLTGTLINKSSFTGNNFISEYISALTFDYNNQDVIAIKTSTNDGIMFKFLFSIIQNAQTSIFIRNTAGVGERLCQLDLLVDPNGKATITERDLKPAVLHCIISGDINQDNFSITLVDGTNKTQAKN